MSPALAPAYVNTWRNHPHKHKGYLFVDQPVAVFKARVNMTTASYPFQQIAFDGVTTGAYGDIEEGQTLLLGSTDGADDYGRVCVRSATSSLIDVGRTSCGTRDGELDLHNNAYITVLDDHRVWAKNPYITSEGVTYKWGGMAYTEGHPPPPVCIIGRGMGEANFVDTDGYYTVNLDAGDSYAVANAATISAYLWDVKDGTIIVGSSTSSAIWAHFPAGRRWISCTITDSNSKTHKRWYLIAALEKTGVNAPITNFKIDKRVQKVDGQQITFTIKADVPETVYPDGAAVIYFEHETYGDVLSLSGSVDRHSLTTPYGAGHVKFAGWHHTDPADINATENGVITQVQFECLDAAGKLNTLPGFPQNIKRDVSPADWQEMAYLNIDRYLWYLLKWHSTAMDVADFTWSGLGDTYPVPTLGSPGLSLYQQVDNRCQAIAHRLTCDRVGRLSVKPDPMLQDGGDRTSTVIVSILESDWSTVSYTRTRPPRVHWNWGSTVMAQAADADSISNVIAFKCVAPGEAPGQGVNAQQKGEQLVVSQSELNAREGHRYAARMNAPYSHFQVDLAHGNDADIDPACMEWVTFTISADAAAQRGLTFTADRFLPLEVHTRYDHENQTKSVRLLMEAETSGFPASTVKLKSTVYGANWTSAVPKTPYWSFPEPPDIYLPALLGSPYINAINNMVGANDDGYLYRTGNYGTTEAEVMPTWGRVSAGVSGTPQNWVVDAYSPKYTGEGTAVNGWITTNEGIYYIEDALGTPSSTLQFTFQSADGKNNIDFSFGAEGWGVCTIHYSRLSAIHGTYATYTRDGGITWSPETAINTNYLAWPYDFSGQPGLYVSPKTPGLVYTTAFVGGRGRLFKSVDYGANWTQDTSFNIDTGNMLGSTLHFPYHNSNDDTVFYSYGVESFSRIALDTFRATIGSSPVYVNGYGAKWGRFQIQSSPLRSEYMVLSGSTHLFYGLASCAIFVSTNAGENWTTVDTLTGAGANPYRVAMSGDDPSTFYTFGRGLMKFTNNLGATFDNRWGNLSDFSPGTFIGLAGG